MSPGSAAPIPLGTGLPGKTMGGFRRGRLPILAESRSYVASGQIRFVLASDGGGFPGGRGEHSEVIPWVTSNRTVVTVGGTTVYGCAATG